ncbi:MAG TPA: hypothetical protein VL742_15110 [Casimicrobiaceae bacterium]|nr:hypothetical protein [Casimicrobiaceae bacterium]
MRLPGDLDYAQARLAARFGERPDEVAWRTIEAIRGLPALLEAARDLPFRRWIAALPGDADAHAIEAALVAKRRAAVEEVARWMPRAWKGAVEWAGVLAELPVLEHLARRDKALPWMREDALYGALCAGEGAPTSGPLAPLAAGWERPDGLLPAWRREWLRRVPSTPCVRSALIEALSRTLASSRHISGDLPTGPSRAAIAARLVLLFRRATGDPAAAFVYLALSALDLERLRGELLRRALFSGFRLAA